MHSLSPNTQAILLLTGPLIAGGAGTPDKVLSLSEYNKLAKRLGALQREPADLLLPGGEALLHDCAEVADVPRLQALLARGFLLAQVVEHWQARSIWVVSRADPDYPRHLKDRLKKDAPAVIYGCGDGALLAAGGLAVVGSRDADSSPELMAYTTAVGELAARSGVAIVSGGARGVDLTAMVGALDAGGRACGILVGDLERTALKRDNRRRLMDGQLVLISPFDPNARFQHWNAMGRNKLIYAQSHAALVVEADPAKGGTRDGALEQLDKLHFVPVYVRSSGAPSPGLEALRAKGALPWPEPRTPQDLAQVFDAPATPRPPSVELPLFGLAPPPADDPADMPPAMPADIPTDARADTPADAPVPGQAQDPAQALFSAVRAIVLPLLKEVMSDAEIAAQLDIGKKQAGEWLKRLCDEGHVVKSRKPPGYVATAGQSRLI